MSRIGKHFNANPGDYNSNDIKQYGDGISTEYIIAMNDLGFGSIINDSRTRALTKKTNCTIEVTPRILNKRVNLYRWVKYAIIRISGPDEASMNQFLRLLERHFPVFLQLKEYTRRANVTIFTNDINMPDNIPGCNPIMRSASTMSSCQGLLVKSPFEASGRRLINQLPWKILKPEITGRYFQTHLCENTSQPSIPPYICSRNLDSNSKLFSGSFELDANKINKNKLFGSMGTLSDSNNPDNAENQYAPQTGENIIRDAKSSQTYNGNLSPRNSTFSNIPLERAALLKSNIDERALIAEYTQKNKMISEMKRKSFQDPLNPNIYYGNFDDENKSEHFRHKQATDACTQGALKISNQFIIGNIDSTPDSGNIDCHPFADYQSEVKTLLDRKPAGQSRANIKQPDLNKTVKKSVFNRNEIKNQKNLQKNVVTNQVCENVSRKLQQYQVLNATQGFPKTTDLETVRNQQCNQIPINHSSLHSLDSLSNSPTHSKTVSQGGEVTSASRIDNQGQEIISDPNKRDMADTKIQMSFTSTSGMCNFVTNIIMMNIPASEIVHSSQIIDYRTTANNSLPLVSASSNVIPIQDNCQSKEIAQIEHKTSSVRGVDDWVCLSKDTTFPVYTSSQSMIAVEPEQTSCINTEPQVTLQQSRDSQNFKNSPNILEIKTSIVSDGMARDCQIQVKEMKFESVRKSTSNKSQMSPVELDPISVQPVSGVSKNVTPPLSLKDSPSGFYVNGINRASQRSQDLRNPIINITDKREIINSISEKLKNPKDGTLIIMFEGNDIYCTGQMSMSYKPVESKERVSKSSNHYGTDNFQIFFESTEYFVTAESRGLGGPKLEQIKTFHFPQFDQCLTPK